MRQESNFGKVILRTRDRRLIKGFSKSDFIDDDSVRLIDAKGNQETHTLGELKAIFFVKDFGGDPDYRVVRFFGKGEPNQWLWAHVVFEDGEVMEGRVRNSRALFDSPGFYLWPSDEGTNNDVVFVIKSAVADFRIMGLY